MEKFSARELLVATARRLFAEHGFAGTSTEQVLAASGVSRGALYHHFEDKRALFAAVLEEVERDFAIACAQAAQLETDPVEALRAGLRAFIGKARDPEVRQIILTDALSVVGWAAWREIEERYGLGLIQQGLEAAAAQQRLRPEDVKWLANVLLAACMELVFLTASAPDVERAIPSGLERLDRVLDRLLTTG